MKERAGPKSPPSKNKKMDYKNLGKEVRWGITSIISGMILGLIISVSIISADWLFTVGVPADVLVNSAGASLFISPFIIGGGLQFVKTKKIITAVIVGVLATLLTLTVGVAILFGLGGGGLST